MKDGFYVQMHMHTSETSGCGRAAARDMVREAKELGYGMLCITDHFMNANIRCDRSAPWEEKVETLFRGYYEALDEGEKLGIRIVRGWETMTPIGGPEILTYGLGEKFLLMNPDIAEVGLREYVERAGRAGGWLVHAHPYRERDYITPFIPDVTGCDAIEVLNGGHRGNGQEYMDDKALLLAEQTGLPGVSGSDAHRTEYIGRGAMRFERELIDVDDLFREIKTGRFEIIEDLRNFGNAG